MSTVSRIVVLVMCAALLLVEQVSSQECSSQFDFSVKTREGSYKKTQTYASIKSSQENGDLRHNFLDGVIGDGDCAPLIANGVTPVFSIVECSPAQSGITIHVAYEMTINSVIRCFTIEDLTPGQFGGYADWRYGGAGSKNVTVLLDSHPGYGLNYLITFF